MAKSREILVVSKGLYKGAKGYISRRNKKSVVLTLSQSFNGSDACRECNDPDGDCWTDHEDGYSGETITVPNGSVTGAEELEILTINKEIKEKALSLRGLILRKKMIEQPEVADKEVEKILSCLEEASD